MDYELRRAREKLNKEQSERKEIARKRLERERKAKDEARKQREALEAVRSQRAFDAQQAQIKADEEMQESLTVGRGIVFSRVLEAVACQGSGDKIKLPSSCFNELSDVGVFDKGPLFFKLSVVHQEGKSEPGDEREKSRSMHSGVLEFTADEGLVGLPPHVWQNIFPGNTPAVPLIEVRYAWLPKGTYAKLQPLRVGFSDLPNHKAILETTLRQHATLSEDEIFIVNYGDLVYKLKVLELKPSSSISVLETDIEVDIVGPDTAIENSDDNVLKPLAFGKSVSGMVNEGHYMYYKFSIENAIWENIASGDATVELRIEPEANSGDSDIYISKHPLIFPTRHQHEWSSHDIGLKTLILSSKDKSLEAGTYTIGVYGFKGETKYHVSVNIQDVKNQKVGQKVVSSSSSMDVDTVECKNCKRYIPSRSIALHEAYCSRNNVVCQHTGCGVVLRVEEAKNHVHCEKCGQPLHQEEMEKHMKVFHDPLYCPCGIVLEKEDMMQHQASVCPLRLVPCRFCGDMVHAGSSAADVRDKLRGLSEHESLCGSRTAPCDSCGRSVMLKDMDIHRVAVHQKN